MTLEEFRRSVKQDAPPALRPALVALWHDAKGDWTRAHEAAQAIEDETGAWVHAYLHRKEGDHANAAYWYRQAGKAIARETLEEEFEAIVTALLSG